MTITSHTPTAYLKLMLPLGRLPPSCRRRGLVPGRRDPDPGAGRAGGARPGPRHVLRLQDLQPDPLKPGERQIPLPRVAGAARGPARHLEQVRTAPPSAGYRPDPVPELPRRQGAHQNPGWALGSLATVPAPTETGSSVHPKRIPRLLGWLWTGSFDLLVPLAPDILRSRAHLCPPARCVTRWLAHASCTPLLRSSRCSRPPPPSTLTPRWFVGGGCSGTWGSSTSRTSRRGAGSPRRSGSCARPTTSTTGIRFGAMPGGVRAPARVRARAFVCECVSWR